MNRDHLVTQILGLLLLAAVVLTAPGQALTQEKCCFNNYRFAGGCVVVPSGSETCSSILAYLNSFDFGGARARGRPRIGKWPSNHILPGS
jgi:hypothetical protein